MEKVYIVLEDTVDLYDANAHRRDILSVFDTLDGAKWFAECYVEQHPGAINKKSVNERIQTFEVDNSTTKEGHTLTIVETEVRTNP